jgi:UDP-N-acetylmuramoyl-L-alanyl-D-glutamate--2,6-diaminopimelate ligase
MKEVAAGIGAHPDVIEEQDRAQAIRLAMARADPDDLVLVCGKGHEQTQQQGDTTTPFSDVAIVRSGLKL